MKNIFNFKGIKCDTCNYKNENISYKEYASYVNKPCPYCGSVLLTEEDYKKCQLIIRYGKILTPFTKDKNKSYIRLKTNWENLIGKK